MKINPSKHPGEDEDIVQEEKVLAMENKDEGTEVSLYNIFKKKEMNYNINHDIQVDKTRSSTPINILTTSQLLPPDLPETQQKSSKSSSQILYSTYKFLFLEIPLSYNKTPSLTLFIKSILIYLTLYIKTY